MKLTRKLIPAMIMLLVSAVLMSTASFAWFAMNTQVTAEGMEVKAKADSIFLEIKGNQDTDWDVVGTDMELDGEGNVKTPVELYPAAHKTFAAAADVTTASKWFYKYATDPDTAEATGDEEALGSLEGYVYQTSFKVRLNPNMVKEAANLRVTGVDLPENTGITLVLTCGTTVLEDFKADYTASGSDTGKVLLADMGDDEVTINAYIYIDGENTNVKTNNASALFGEVSFTLTVSAKS